MENVFLSCAGFERNRSELHGDDCRSTESKDVSANVALGSSLSFCIVPKWFVYTRIRPIRELFAGQFACNCARFWIVFLLFRSVCCFGGGAFLAVLTLETKKRFWSWSAFELSRLLFFSHKKYTSTTAGKIKRNRRPQVAFSPIVCGEEIRKRIPVRMIQAPADPRGA